MAQIVLLVKHNIASSLGAGPMVLHNQVLMLLVCKLMQWSFLHRILLHSFRHPHHNHFSVLFHNLNVNNCYHICQFLRIMLVQVLEHHMLIKLQL